MTSFAMETEILPSLEILRWLVSCQKLAIHEMPGVYKLVGPLQILMSYNRDFCFTKGTWSILSYQILCFLCCSTSMGPERRVPSSGGSGEFALSEPRKVFAMQASCLPRSSLDDLIRFFAWAPTALESSSFKAILWLLSFEFVINAAPASVDPPSPNSAASAHLKEAEKHLISWRIMPCCSFSHSWFMQLSSSLLY